MEKIGEDLWIIGDDSPVLFVLDSDLSIKKTIPLLAGAGEFEKRIPKLEKPDFEATTLIQSDGKNELFIFGSGSFSPQRDLLIRIDVNHHTESRTQSLTRFYAEIRKIAFLRINDFNIEAAASDLEKLWLFNRGINGACIFKISDFLSFLDEEGPFPIPEIHSFQLPQIVGLEARLSGASFTPNEEWIVCTASLENTGNWIDDGEVLGSFIGIIKPHSLESEFIPIMDENKLLKVKVESVTVCKAISDQCLHLYLVTDGDSTSSELLKVELNGIISIL